MFCVGLDRRMYWYRIYCGFVLGLVGAVVFGAGWGGAGTEWACPGAGVVCKGCGTGAC